MKSMKRKLLITITAALVLIAMTITAASAAQSAPEVPNNVELTEAQKNELKQLSDKMFEAKKQLIEKYADFGIISRKQAEYRLKKIEEKQKRFEENGFIPRYGRDKKMNPKKSIDKDSEAND